MQAGNWYKVTGTVVGINSSVETGILVKGGNSIKVDDITLSKQGEYSVFNKNGYYNSIVSTWDTFCEGTLSGSTCTQDSSYSGNASVRYQICIDDVGNADGTNHGTECQNGSLWKYWDGDSWETATDTTSDVNTKSDLDIEAMNALPIISHKISVKLIFIFGGEDIPRINNISIGLTTDTTIPSVNASDVKLKRTSASDISLDSESWTNSDAPYFYWQAGQDAGSGIKGYCLYLGHDDTAVPNQSGVSEENPEGTYLGTSPVPVIGSECAFIISTPNVNFSTANSTYRGSSWLTTSNDPYYLKVWAIDNSNNIRTADPALFAFYYDDSLPTNVAYISPTSGSFSSVEDMSFSWPTSGNVASSDANSQVLGWQYQINGTDPAKWKGTETSTTLGIRYIPTGTSVYNLTIEQDAYEYDSEGNPVAPIIVTGNNVVYFRTVDNAGNYSSDSTVRTGNLQFGGAAPYFGGTDAVTVNPTSSDTNNFALSWPAATATTGQTVAHYYYMINAEPPLTLETLQDNPSTYFDNGTSRVVSAKALSGVNKGSNTVRVVAVDNDDPANYSPSNVIQGTFNLNSSDPDNVGSLSASDSSIKEQSQWNVTLTWTAPVYQGAGNLQYLVFRSTNGTGFSEVGRTSGLSYVDNTPNSQMYYYKVYTVDGADAQSSGTNAVSITPTGKWTEPPDLVTGPTASSVSTRKVIITWSTSRAADSKVAFGTKSGNYYSTEPSNSSQVTAHSIELTGLNPSTSYYYKVKWTDEDGNTGESEEKFFTTSSAPYVKEVKVKNISLYSGIIQFTSKGASQIKVYYGKSTGFGGVKKIDTSTSESKYLIELSGLDDGTKYYFRINTVDAEANEYEGNVIQEFTTLPKPEISKVRVQQVSNTAQTAVLVSWITNTEISSIVTYYPDKNKADARDAIAIKLVKGEHKMVIKGLKPQEQYVLVVQGVDKAGNEAVSDLQQFTTATDTRPPKITDFTVEGTSVKGQKPPAQLIISWTTDEPATSQVEFGEGAGHSYSAKTQEDNNFTYNHIVIVSSLSPSSVYHLRAISKDSAGNIEYSSDNVTITPKGTESALNLVIFNLQEAFGFLGNL